MQSCSQIITINKPTSSFFTGRMPFLLPNQQCQSTEGKNITFLPLLTPSSPGGLPALSLTTNSSWLPWGRYRSIVETALSKSKWKIDSGTRIKSHQNKITNFPQSFDTKAGHTLIASETTACVVAGTHTTCQSYQDATNVHRIQRHKIPQRQETTVTLDTIKALHG